MCHQNMIEMQHNICTLGLSEHVKIVVFCQIKSVHGTVRMTVMGELLGCSFIS